MKTGGGNTMHLVMNIYIMGSLMQSNAGNITT